MARAIDMRELDKLEQYLKQNNMVYQRIRRLSAFTERTLNVDGGEQIIVYENGERVWDVICGHGSYGAQQGLLEVMGDPVVIPEDGDSVAGYLKAVDVIKRLENFYKERGSQNAAD